MRKVTTKKSTLVFLQRRKYLKGSNRMPNQNPRHKMMMRILCTRWMLMVLYMPLTLRLYRELLRGKTMDNEAKDKSPQNVATKGLNTSKAKGIYSKPRNISHTPNKTPLRKPPKVFSLKKEPKCCEY